MEEDELIKNS